MKPTALPNSMDAERIRVHPTDHFHVVMDRLQSSFRNSLLPVGLNGELL